MHQITLVPQKLRALQIRGVKSGLLAAMSPFPVRGSPQMELFETG